MRSEAKDPRKRGQHSPERKERHEQKHDVGALWKGLRGTGTTTWKRYARLGVRLPFLGHRVIVACEVTPCQPSVTDGTVLVPDMLPE